MGCGSVRENTDIISTSSFCYVQFLEDEDIVQQDGNDRRKES